MKRWTILILGIWLLGTFAAGIPAASAAQYDAGNDYNLYGHLCQYDIPGIAKMACCPTTSINSLTYLQNQFPNVYGNRLIPSAPASSDVLAIAGPSYMKTDKDNGTTDALSIWGRYLYIESKAPLQTEYSCQIAMRDGKPVSGSSTVPWPDNQPVPAFRDTSATVPTWQFLYDNLKKGADVGIAISYVNDMGIVTGGHCMTVHRITFDDKNGNGRVDPGEGTIAVLDPAKTTEATYNIWQNTDPGFLNGEPHLLIDRDGSKALLELVLAEYPKAQTVSDTVQTGNILVMHSNSSFGVLTFRGGVLYAAEAQMAWTKPIILGSEGGVLDSAANQFTLSGVISGPGMLNKYGSGTLLLRGNNTYSGGTLVAEGVLNIVQEANLGDPAGSLSLVNGILQAGADLTINRPVKFDVREVEGRPIGNSGFDTGTYHSVLTGEIAGSGAMTQMGQGSLTLTGASPNFAGSYTVDSGTLILEGTMGGRGEFSMTVNPNGTLKGSGYIRAGYLYNSGTVNPGNSVGTLTVEGGYFPQPSGRLEIEVASATSYDRLSLTGYYGVADLKGALSPILMAGYRPPAHTVFQGVIATDTSASAGIYNTFDTIERNTPTRTWEAVYLPDRVDLTLSRDYAGASLGLAPNQQAVGTMLNGVADTTAGDLATVLNALDNLSAPAAVATAYQQISADKAGALPALSLAGSMMQWRSLSSRLTNQRWSRGKYLPLGGDDFGSVEASYSSPGLGGLTLAYNWSDLGGLIRRAPADAKRRGQWEVFADFVGTWGSQDSSANQTGYNFTILGFSGGADYHLRDDLLLGVGSGYYHTGNSYDASGGSAGINSIPLFAYAAYTPGAFYAMGSLGYTLNLYDLNRNVTFGGISRTAGSSVNGNQFNAALETGYDFKFARAIVTPAATLSYSKAWVGGFTETDADSLNLSVDSQNADSLQSGIGLRVSRPFKTGKAEVLPQIFAFYQHEFADDSRALNARLAQAGSTFVFQTDSRGRDFAVLGASLALHLEKNLSLQASYNAELGRGNYTAHFLSAGLRLEF